MVHGSVSPRESFIVVGDQNSDHIVLDVKNGMVKQRFMSGKTYF